MLKLFRWLAGRPLWFLHGLGGFLGWLTYLGSPTYRRRFRENVSQAGIAQAAARPAIGGAGRLALETPFLWLRPKGEPIRPPVRWSGEELIPAAHAQGRGIVFLTPHLGSFEITAQAVGERYAQEFGPITVLYRPARKPWLREVMEGSRERPGIATAPASLAGVRLMIRALRRGEAVGLLPDQVPPDGMGVWVREGNKIRGKFVEVTADRTSRQFASRGEISFTLDVDGDSFTGSAVGKFYDFDNRMIVGPISTAMTGTKVRL